MNQALRIACRVVTVAVLTLLPNLSVHADDKYVESKEPVFLSVQPDHALVYVARTNFQRLIPLAPFEVFVDDVPFGWLPQRSYLAVQVEPGRKLLWGPQQNDPERFEFKAGRTYLLLLVERYMFANHDTLVGTSWVLGDPADVRSLIAAKELSYVTPTEEGLAKLREEAAKKYPKERKNAPDLTTQTLPASFETVWYRPGKRGFSFKAYDATGTLKVDGQQIEFKSDKKTIVIPVKDIQSVALDKITSSLNTADPNKWGIVRFASAGSTEVAAFRDGHSLGNGGDTERIYLTLKAATLPAAGPMPPPAPLPSAVSAPLQDATPPATSAPSPSEALPESFVPYLGLKDQFTIAIPADWMAYDQSQVLKGAPGRFGMVFFLPSKQFSSEAGGEQALMSAEVLLKVDKGDIPSFFVERQPADKGMTCAGFSPKAEKKLVDLIAKDPMFKGKNALEPARVEPAGVAGCKGIRIRAKGQPSPGDPWVADAYMASDGQTLYIFSLRNKAENYEKNAAVFQKAISTAKLSASQ